MDSLKSLQSEHNRSGGQNWIPSGSRWLEIWLKILPGLRMQHFDLENLQRKGLQTLLERPWFKRVWILQEVAKSRRAIVQASSHSISARIFALAPLLIGASVHGHTQAVLDIMPGPSRKNSWWSRKQGLYTLLSRFKDSEATGERDIVYALLGIPSDRESHGFLADYTKTTNDLIRKVCLYLFGNRTEGLNPTQSMSTFLHNFADLNAGAFCDAAKNWTVKDAAKFIDERGDEMIITTAVLIIVALIPQHGAGITKLLYARLSKRQSVITKPVKGSVEADFLLGKKQGKVTEDDLLRLATATAPRFICLVLESRGWDGIITLKLVRALAGLGKAKTGILEFLLWHPDARFTVTEELVYETASWFRPSALHALFDQSKESITITSTTIHAAYANRYHGNDIMKCLIKNPAVRFEVSEAFILEIVAFFDISVAHAFFRDLGEDYSITDKVVAAAHNDWGDSDQVEQLVPQFQEWGPMQWDLEAWEYFQRTKGDEFRSLINKKNRLKKMNAASLEIERKLAELEKFYWNPYLQES